MPRTRARAIALDLERAQGRVEVLGPADLGPRPRIAFDNVEDHEERGGGEPGSPIGAAQFDADKEREEEGGLNQQGENQMGDRDAAAQAARRPAQRARFQYKSFKGKEKEDPDEWLEVFVGTAKANGKDEIKLTTLAGVLKGEARPWYNNLSEDKKQDWERFRTAFLTEFRPRGISNKAIIKIGSISMGKKKSLRKFLQKFNNIIRKMNTKPTDGMKKAWFINALPTKMQFWIKNHKPNTFDEAFLAADAYVDSKASEKSKKKKKKSDEEESEDSTEEEDEKKKKKKKKKKKRKKKAKREESSSSSSSSEESEDAGSESDEEEKSSAKVEAEKRAKNMEKRLKGGVRHEDRCSF
ncbi:unnamed protein product [Calypogeia fissa]